MFEYLWSDFLELNDKRTNNGYTVNPISFQEIDAWSRITKTKITSNDVRIINKLDSIFLEHYQKGLVNGSRHSNTGYSS